MSKSDPSTPDPNTPSTPKPTPRYVPRYTPQQQTRRLVRKIALGLVFGLVLALFGAHTNGYGILIAPSEQVDAPTNGFAMLKCLYFTGTEKVITHVARRVKDGESKASCPLYSLVGSGQLGGRTIPGMGMQPRDDLPGLGPNIQFERIPPGDAPLPASPPAGDAAPATPALPAPALPAPAPAAPNNPAP